MLWLLRFVGSPKIFIPVASVLLVGLILYTMIQYGESKQELKQTLENQQEYINTRQRIDDNVKDVRDIDADAALEWLRERQARDK